MTSNVYQFDPELAKPKLAPSNGNLSWDKMDHGLYAAKVRDLGGNPKNKRNIAYISRLYLKDLSSYRQLLYIFLPGSKGPSYLIIGPVGSNLYQYENYDIGVRGVAEQLSSTTTLLSLEKLRFEKNPINVYETSS